MVWLGVLCANSIWNLFLMYSCIFLLHACIFLSCLHMKDVIEDNLLVIDFGFPSSHAYTFMNVVMTSLNIIR